MDSLPYSCWNRWNRDLVGLQIWLSIEELLLNFALWGGIATRDTVLCAVVLRRFRGSRSRNCQIRAVSESLFGRHFHHPWKCHTMGVVASVRSQTNRRRFNVTLLTPMLVIRGDGIAD